MNSGAAAAFVAADLLTGDRAAAEMSRRRPLQQKTVSMASVASEKEMLLLAMAL